ncbi:FAD-dependent oxidoreductase [Phenylobacterium montanum]|uniref:FAD-dependent oxidoreductase n=1 Tax=Phenylobacterium montanum TaxID=2823693 RepID=A0A975G1C6_9CAUL|nr:FAD-dependent oxidoreductase [Caulobacter sp. S6]QUD88941.1 FAD-dependent oxidoreductase [Caulobacter sp. S6]
MAATQVRTCCCIVGGGPAGVMAGFLLARAGVRVTVLEKHADFLRDFRGDTVHPSTMQVLADVGLLDEFLKRPHSELSEISGRIGTRMLKLADTRHLPTAAKFVAVMPQWDFLNFLSGAADRYPAFRLLMSTEAGRLIEEGGRVVGVEAHGPDGALEIRADLVLGCDGRTSQVRAEAGLTVRDIGAPIDVLWFRLPRRPDDAQAALGNIGPGYMLVMIDRNDYYQCGFVIPKGGIEAVKAQGLAAFKASLAAIQPMIADRLEGLRSWDDVKLLTVTIDRLERWWRPGLLCIGDAAHAMSPVGGVGINLAIQDAVAAANQLAAPLREGRLSDADLAAIQKRRTLPMRLIQGLQVAVQERVLAPALKADQPFEPPWPALLLDRVPLLRRIPARVLGMGFRMERVKTPEHPGAAA